MSWTTRYKASITNQNQGGGNAKEGLPPSVGKGNLSVWNGMGRAYGTPEDRALQVCINQLGSVNPRVYQSRYCGKVSNNRNTRDCDPQFTIESNQWLRQQDTDVGRYDICFVLDKSGSMREDADGVFPPPPGEPSKWNLLTRFMRIFHNLVLNQSLQNDGNELQGDKNLHAPAHIPKINNVIVDPQNCNYADPSYRLSFLTFSNNSELNLTYNTYVSQIFQPQEAGQPPAADSEIPQDKKEFPITEGRFNQLLDAFGIPGGGTNGAEAVQGLTELHETHQFFNGTSYVGPQGNYVPASIDAGGNQTPASGDPNSRCGNYIQRYNNRVITSQVCGSDITNPLSCSNENGEMPGDKETNLAGELPRNIAIPGAAQINYPNNFDSGNPANGNDLVGNYQEAVVPIGELNAGQLSLPPYRYPITGTQNIGYRNGWRNLNTILIWVTDGAINVGNGGIVNFTNQIAILNAFENNLLCNSIFSKCLTRIAIGFGSGAVVDELEAFAGINNQDYTGIVPNGDEYHRVINQANLSVQTMTQLAEDVLSSVTNISFTQTDSPEYSILSLNRGTSCPYTDTQFINEIIPLIQDLIDNGGKLSTLDLTGQILLTNVTLEALIVIPDFLANIKTLILSGCSDMTDNAITSLITILNGGDGNPQNGLVNLDLSFTGITSAGISTLVTDGNVPGVQSSLTLKYLNIDGIPFPNTNTGNVNNPINLNNVMSGLSQNTSIECLSMQSCQLDNNMLDINNLKKLIETPSSLSNLIHIHLDQNNMDFNEITTFVTNQNGNGFNPNNKIASLTRVFMQFQKKNVQGILPNPPNDNVVPTNVWVEEELLQVNNNNAVIIGQYLTSEVQAINGVTPPINGNLIPVFVANGYAQANDYQAWVEIPLGSGQFRVGGTYQTPAPTDPWYEPGIFNHNNPNVVLGKVLY